MLKIKIQPPYCSNFLPNLGYNFGLFLRFRLVGNCLSILLSGLNGNTSSGSQRSFVSHTGYQHFTYTFEMCVNTFSLCLSHGL